LPLALRNLSFCRYIKVSHVIEYCVCLLNTRTSLYAIDTLEFVLWISSCENISIESFSKETFPKKASLCFSIIFATGCFEIIWIINYCKIIISNCSFFVAIIINSIRSDYCLVFGQSEYGSLAQSYQCSDIGEQYRKIEQHRLAQIQHFQ